MAIHGLTRVQFQGDKVVVVAGPIPPHIAVQGLTKELVEATPVATPMTPVRHIPPKAKTPVEPAQAEKQEEK